MKQLWVDRFSGEFLLQSCKAIAAYLLHKTGITCDVHKTERYVYINYTKDGNLHTEKIEVPAGVLYCLREEDFDALVAKMCSKKTGRVCDLVRSDKQMTLHHPELGNVEWAGHSLLVDGELLIADDTVLLDTNWSVVQ